MNQLHLKKTDRDNFFHPSTHLADFSRGDIPSRIMTEGHGVYVRDADGNQLLDGFAGLYCVNVGYGQKKVIDAITNQANKLAYYHSYIGHSTEASIMLSKMIIDRAPKNMSKVYYGLSGSDANETAIKIIWYYNNILELPKKKKIISRWRSYHGSGLISGSLTGLSLFHNQFDLPLPQVIHTEAPYYYHRKNLSMTERQFSVYCAEELEKLIVKEGHDTIAAFIGEPVLGTGGLVPPPEGYWSAIQQVLNKYNILLVSDEVVNGFGRLGSMFGAELYDMKPDIMTCAKGLTSAYMPLSATIVSEKIWEVLIDGNDKFGAMGHGWTYSGHPISVAAGVSCLEVVDELNLLENAQEMGKYLIQELEQSIGNHKNVGEVRGIGLLCGVELIEDKINRKFFSPMGIYASKVVNTLLVEHNIIVRAMPQGDIIGLAPPLIINKNEIDRLVSGLKEAIEQIFGK